MKQKVNQYILIHDPMFFHILPLLATPGFLLILPLGFALLFNIAGFDLIYALQDIDFDKAHKLHSVPAKFGRRMTLAIAACSFALSAVFLTSVGVVFKLNAVYAACVAVIACLYVFGVITIALFGVKKTQLVFLYESISISGLIFLGIASNLF